MTTTNQAQTKHVKIEVRNAVLNGDLTLPSEARGLVVFAHGSGSSRHSPRNRFVATRLNANALGTLLFDLLTPAEEAIDEATRRLRFDIPLLARRLEDAVEWIAKQDDIPNLPLGVFGASTGAAAALIAAAEQPDAVRAVVSRGGRPDLADRHLADVQAPTLLIVGGDDTQVIELNREAEAKLTKAQVSLEIVPGASHLFEEPGTLEKVANLASDWFVAHLR